MMSSLRVFVDGIGLIGPGLRCWADAAAVLRGESAWTPQPTQFPAAATLPPAERRRVGNAVRLALAVGYEAAAAAEQDPAALATVFASSGSDGDNCHTICQMLATSDRQISPTRFHNSVHNAPAGYWSIATGAMTPSTSLCAFDGSFGAGLLEAATQVATAHAPVLLIAYDTGYPEPLRRVRPIADAFGVALLLSPLRGATTEGCVEVALASAAADTMASPALEALRRGYPAARALSLLAALASRQHRRIVLDYLADLQLVVTTMP